MNPTGVLVCRPGPQHPVPCCLAGLAERPDASAIVGAIVAMGHALNLSIVAEGIETEDQAREALRLGCDSGQGYLFARPAPAATAAGMPHRDRPSRRLPSSPLDNAADLAHASMAPSSVTSSPQATGTK